MEPPPLPSPAPGVSKALLHPSLLEIQSPGPAQGTNLTRIAELPGAAPTSSSWLEPAWS